VNKKDRQFIASELVLVAKDLVRVARMDKQKMIRNLKEIITDVKNADKLIDDEEYYLKTNKPKLFKWNNAIAKDLEDYDGSDDVVKAMKQLSGEIKRVKDIRGLSDMAKKIEKNWTDFLYSKTHRVNAKTLTAADSLIDYSDGIQGMSQRDVAGLRSNADEITYKLAVDVYKNLRKRFELSSGEKEAIKRLQAATGMRNPDMIRNNVFKAANALGMKLPHSNF
jgi:hypothetical protein